MSTPNVEAVKLDELNCWRIRHGQAELLVAQQGAHILSYQVAGEPPLIWLNDEAVFKTGKSIRAGVPVCWPWFGNLPRNPQSVQAMRVSNEPPTAHGLVRAMDWELGGIETEGESLKVEFVLPYPEGGLPGWPHQVDLKLSIRLDEQLHISLTSHNQGTDNSHHQPGTAQLFRGQRCARCACRRAGWLELHRNPGRLENRHSDR